MMTKFLTTAAIGATLSAGLLTASMALAAPQSAPAAAVKGPPAKMMTQADFLAHADARFDRLDTNKDGQLSADERRAGPRGTGKQAPAAGKAPRPMGPERVQIDTNSDGLISKAEHRAAAQARFTRMDANKDGSITRGEGRPMRGKWAGHRGGKFTGHHGPRGAMMRADADKDGVITRAEFDAQNAARFARLDSNKDGKIDATELRAQRGKRGDTWAGRAKAAPSGDRKE